MKIIIEDHCIRCGICIDTAPDLFERATEDDVIKVKVEHIDGPLQESGSGSGPTDARSGPLSSWNSPRGVARHA